MDVFRVALLDCQGRAVPIGRAGESDDRKSLRILMQVVDHYVPALGADTGDQCIELDDLPLYIRDAEPLADLTEDPDVDTVIVLRLFVLIGVGRIVGDAERDPVRENALVGSVAAIEAYSRGR